MKKSFENPAYQKEDLEIKKSGELEEAKKEAGVKSHKDALADALEHAEETGDNLLKENVKGEIIKDYLGKPESAPQKERTAAEKEMVKKWDDFLKKHFPEKKFDLSGIEIPKRTPEEEKEFTRLQFRTNKLPLFKKCEELFPSVNHTDNDIDKIIANGNIEDSFIWVRDNEAADEEHKNKSANMIKKEGLNTETIGDRILHELKYFEETGDHLDKETGTLTSSRDSGGGVLDAGWGGGGFRVGWCDPDDRGGGWRFRQVVSAPTKSEK